MQRMPRGGFRLLLVGLPAGGLVSVLPDPPADAGGLRGRRHRRRRARAGGRRAERRHLIVGGLGVLIWSAVLVPKIASQWAQERYGQPLTQWWSVWWGIGWR